MKCRAISWLWNWNISEINSHLEDSSVGNGTGMLENKMELAGHENWVFGKTDFLQSQQQLSLCLSDCHLWTTLAAGLPVSLRSTLRNSEVRGACVQRPAYRDYRCGPWTEQESGLQLPRVQLGHCWQRNPGIGQVGQTGLRVGVLPLCSHSSQPEWW